MKHIITSLLLLTTINVPVWSVTESRKLLDKDWLFSLEADSTAASPAYDDSGWKSVNLPHDWSVEHDFDRECPSGNDGGYLPTGTGWYRKTINLDSAPAGTEYLYLEGAYMDSRVWVNGTYAGGHPYGYTSYRIDITPYLHAGDNTIAISVDNSKQKNSRWYSGSGIYRHVWLESHPSIHIRPWSMHVTTPVVKPDSAVARVQFTLTCPGERSEDLRMPVTVKSERADAAIYDTVLVRPSEKEKYLSYDITIASPKLWSPETPELYTAEVTLGNGDKETETFGIRSFSWSTDGCRLNGKPIVLSGACVHHDNGILGAASHDDAEYRKAALLKEAGFNAVRTSHNPPAPAFLDACDRLGLLVIDEAFDGWREAKTPYDYSTLLDKWWAADLGSMIERDRNHPSIIAWSIGNEILERKSPEAVATARMFAAKCREIDSSRPVTQALASWDPDWEIYDALAAEHDIIGYNYMIHKAEGDHARVPSRVIWQTESYPRDAFSNWTKVADLPYVIGDFVWTGIDYIGESGIGRHYYEGDPEGEHFERPLWPWHNSQCGDIDITGARKPISYYRELLYAEKPMLSLAVREPDGYKGKVKETMWGTWPTYKSWNWPGHNGKPITVEVASSYPKVELYLNDRLIGTKNTGRAERFMAEFEIPYTPGTLRAVAIGADGHRADSAIIETAGRPVAIRLIAEPAYGPSPELAYIVAEIVDARGRIVPDATNMLTFSTDGNAEILATGSPDPTDPAGYTRRDRKAAQGRVLVIVKPGPSGNVVLTAKAKGLKKAVLKL